MLYGLYVDGEVISTTGEHPFWGPDIGWVEAEDLAANNLPSLKGKSETEIRDILQKDGFTQTKVSNSPARNETWDHPDGSQVRIHPYGNHNLSPYKTGNNAHIHKQDPAGNQLNDRSIPSTNPADTHIGIPNPPDLPQIRNRPHGA